MFRRLVYYGLQLKAFLVFGTRVYAHGNFQVGNSRNVVIGQRCSINSGVYILGRGSVRIGNRVVLSARSMLLDSGLDVTTAARNHSDGFIQIGDGAWIGAGAIILPNVTIGEGSVVGAGSVVSRDVAPFTIVAGNPARPIGIVKRANDPDTQEIL